MRRLFAALFFVIPWNLSLIGAPDAWTVTRGSPSVIIAVLDTGIDADHPEFAGRILPGYDFVHDDADPADEHGHGTAVASIAAGATVGVCPECSVMPVQVLSEYNNGRWGHIAAGIVWAADNGADVINLSLGSTDARHDMSDAVEYAHSRGVALVAAAGNGGTATIFYPASHPVVWGVAATDAEDALWWLSNTGPAVDIAAPGVRIYAATRNGHYAYWTGTSAAAPHVAGLAGLLLSQGHAPEDVGRIIMNTAVDLGAPGFDVEYGHGRIDAWAAVRGGTATVPPVRVWRWWFPWLPRE